MILLGIIIGSAQDLTRGVYVERLSEVAVSSLAEAFQVPSRLFVHRKEAFQTLTGNDWYELWSDYGVYYVESR